MRPPSTFATVPRAPLAIVAAVLGQRLPVLDRFGHARDEREIRRAVPRLLELPLRAGRDVAVARERRAVTARAEAAGLAQPHGAAVLVVREPATLEQVR